jgi:RNA polymerase sigma-70 factor (ECF subfamily)
MISGSAAPRLRSLLGAGAPESVVAIARSPSDDARLVSGIAAREPWAIAELFDRYSDLVQRMLYRTLGSRIDLEDLAQETFLKVIARAPTLRDPSALPGFVIGVAVRMARNEVRKRSLRRWVGLEHAPSPGIEDDPVLREQITHAYAALERLDATSRVIFVLRYVEELGLPEIARSLELSLATVKRRLTRAEARLEAIAAGDPVLSGYLRRG